MKCKQFEDKYRAIDAYCFDCGNCVSLVYNQVLTIKSDKDDPEIVIKLPVPKFRCSRCEKEISVSSNAVGNFNKVINNFIHRNDIIKTNFNMNYTKANNNGIIIADHNFIQDYTYPSIVFGFDGHIPQWKYISILCKTVFISEPEYGYERLITIDLDLEKETLSINLEKDVLIDAFVEVGGSEDFVDFINRIFDQFLNCASSIIEEASESEEALQKIINGDV